MPSAEFPLGIYIQGKDFQSKKPLFCSPSPKKGNLKALLQNWPIGGLEPDTFVKPPQPGAERGWATGTLPHRRRTVGEERGLMGKGAGGDLGGSPGEAARTPKHLPPPPRPQPRVPNGSVPQNK